MIAARTLRSSLVKSSLTNFNRTYGALGWRATICFRLQAVCTPFHAGRVRMAFEPLIPTGSHHSRGTSITPLSQLPGVELDLAESTSVILKIPFIHPQNYFPISDTNDVDTLGTLFTTAYTPVALAPGILAPKLVLWTWLEDFELVGATSTNIQAQSGKFTKKKDVSSLEAEAVPGNVSNVLSAGANFSTWLGRKIPTISTYAGMTSWALRFISNVAASHGWAKPILASPPNKIINSYNIYQNNCDGPDAAFNLGATTDNTVAAYPGFAGTDVDEMSFDFLTSVYTALSAPNVAITQSADTVLYSAALCPLAMYNNGTSKSVYSAIGFTQGRAFWPTPLFSLADCFAQWRGGFRFRVKISKTKFHTGRLLLGFLPYSPRAANLSFTPSDLSDMQFKSLVWDLREGNVVEFDCPFISPVAYLRRDEAYGSFFISVLDPLVGPDTVSTTCPMVIEVSGMEDFEFAVPVTAQYVVAPITTLYSAQSGEFEPIGVSNSNKDALHCVGERISSVKQLINRANPIAVLAAGSAIEVSERIRYPIWLPNVSAPTSIIQMDNDYLTRFKTAYAMYRGGFVVDAVPTRTGVQLTAISNVSDTKYNMIPAISEGRTAVHVKMPYYCNRSRSLTSGSLYRPDNTVAVFAAAQGTTTAAIVYRRAADDYQLGYFFGFAPLTLPLAPAPDLDALLNVAFVSST